MKILCLKLKYMILLVTALLIVVVLGLYIAGVRRKVSDEQPVGNEKVVEDVVVPGKRIAKAEAIRLFSFFFYTDVERADLSDRKAFPDIDGTWYESYVNAGVHAGFLSATGKKLHAEKNLNCGEFRDMLLRVCAKSRISFEDLMLKLPERLKTVKRTILLLGVRE